MRRTGISGRGQMAVAIPYAMGERPWQRAANALRGWGVAAIAIPILIPIATLLVSIFSVPSESLTYLWQHRIPRSIATTLLLCVCVSASTLFFGATTAWLLTRYRLRGERALVVLSIMPLAIPSYIHAYSVGAFIFGGPFLTAWYVLTFSLTPYVFIICRFAFQKESRILFDAAAVQGIRYPFVRLALPMARPALIGAVMLVSMEVLNEYGTFIYLGVETLTTVIFKLWFSYYDIRGAAQLSSYLLIVIIVIASIERRSRWRIDYSQSYTEMRSYLGGGLRRTVAPFAYLYCLLPIVCGMAIPMASLLYWTLRDGLHLFASRQLWMAAAHTIGIAGGGALLCVVVAFALAYGKRRAANAAATRAGNAGRKRGGNAAATQLVDWATFGYVIPGAIIAIAILRVGGTLIAVIGLPLLLFAYTVRYLAVCYHPLQGALSQQCARTDEVAQSLEPSRWRRLWRITLPQLHTPIMAVTILIIFDILKDLPLTIILRPVGLETLALQSFYYASEEQLGSAAPFAVMIFGIGIAVILLTQRGQWNKRKY